MVIENSLDSLKEHIVLNNYRGYDPYDALKSPLFNLPFFRSNKLIRFGTQQFVKRFPINVRPLLLVPKGLNPVSLGLCIQGYAYLILAQPEEKSLYIDRINSLVFELENLVPNGFSGACWGYDFDWEARHAKIPEYQPTVVATGIITNGLYQAWKITKLENLRKLVVSSSNFILNDLNRTYSADSFCFSYSPFDGQMVFNASMKGARLLAQTYSMTKDDNCKETAQHAVEFVIKNQRDNGSWGYSLANSGGWVDNYHTGYILDCLDDYIKLCEDVKYQRNLESGLRYYKKYFFESDGQPAFYSDKLYPADCTAASQSVLTLTRFNEIELASKVAEWTIKNMQAKNGSFYFRKFKYYTINTSFMRWSNAWMFAALSYLLVSKKNESVL